MAGAANAQPGAQPPTAPSPSPDAPGSDAVDMRDILAAQQVATPNASAPEAGATVTGTARAGAYHDSDNTTVWRALGVLGAAWGNWSLGGTVDVDAVTSASVDVRSSPALSQVDVMTSASGRSSTSGGEMTDTRYQLTSTGGWRDTAGHAVNLTGAVATERDYASVSGGANGSYDFADRTITLLGGLNVTDNWVSSVLDSTLHRKMAAVGWSAGIARVLTRDDAIRLRYDGKLSSGYLASPYRNVRFGDWTAQLGTQQITFANTLGSADGLPEKEPETRVSNALVLEWVNSLANGVGLHPALRAAHDSWDVNSLAASLDLRIARPKWRLELGYRFYVQSRANFFEDKYTLDPSMYAYYTSDKELGAEIGHQGHLDFSHVLFDASNPNDRRVFLDLQLVVVHYDYPGFLLLQSRDSVFASAGLSWE